MSEIKKMNPAEIAAKEAIERVFDCIKKRKSFVLEAGAGAGKTFSLVESLRFLIESHGKELIRKKQKIACITYTNVASNEIASRTDSHPAVFSATIHAFCWSLIKDFQSVLRKIVPQIGTWVDRLSEAEVENIGTRKISYDLGYPKVDEDVIWLGHNDVILIINELIKQPKFRSILTNRFPILFIDEYQDTDKGFIEAIKTYFLDTREGPLIGFFGDHWQKIYGTGCGKIEHSNIETVGKKANFRSVITIVKCLNEIRKELPQEVSDMETTGEVNVYHTNNWQGVRRPAGPGGHWAGDLPAEDAHRFLEVLKSRLTESGWDFTSNKSKILMLTHSILASEQGYKNVASVFPYTDQYIKKEDPYISFFIDVLEPVSFAFSNSQFGNMFTALDRRTPRIRAHSDKVKWAESIEKLIALRKTDSIGSVIEHLKKTKMPRLSEKIENKELELDEIILNPPTPPEEVPGSLERLRKLKAISYQEVIALSKFVNEETPFSTKHGVKGAEFENVLIVLGRGWNTYNFNQMLEWSINGIPVGKQDSFERNRNLFYVACSRPKKRLALLFTQELTNDAIHALSLWFGGENIHSIV